MIRTTVTLYVPAGCPEGRLRGRRRWVASRGGTWREAVASCRRCRMTWAVETSTRKAWPALARDAVAGLRRMFPSCDEGLARNILNS